MEEVLSIDFLHRFAQKRSYHY